MQTPIKIENWSFAPETGILRDGTHTNRLEHRTATLLELLARNPKRLISQDEIIAKVWDGRNVSANSVAVAISDIRRALDDDPKAPTFIETVPKRGYRLIADVTLEQEPDNNIPDPVATGPRPVARLGLVGLSAMLALALILVLTLLRPGSGSARMTVAVIPATNQTGDTQYDALTASVTELLAVELARQNAFTVATQSDADIQVSGKLILWDGHASMSIHAISVPSGEVVWSGMASGPETLLPRQVRAEIAEFAAHTDSHAANHEALQ